MWSKIKRAFSSAECTSVPNVISAESGGSYGSSMPVKPRISPRRALAYRPFGSRRSQVSKGVSTNTSKKHSGPTMFRISSRVSRYGLTAAHTATPPWRTISEATNPMRRTLVFRSSRLKPSSLERFVRTTSPSSSVTWRPCSSSRTLSISAVVVLPAPLNPVNQTQRPWASRSAFRSKQA